MAVTVVNPDEFTDVGLVSLKEVLTYTPGFSSNNTSGSPAAGFLVVRGVAPDGAGKGTATTAVYLDGMALSSSAPFGSGSVISFDGLLGDVERVEFLKGPQGTLYGSGAVGGTIKYVTRKPSLNEVSGAVGVDASSIKEGGNASIYNARITTPLVEDKLGITLAGFYEKNDGFTDRVDAGTGELIKEDTNSYDRYGLSADLYFEASDRLNLRARVLNQKTDSVGIAWQTLLPGTTAPLYAPLTNAFGVNDLMLETDLYSTSVNYQFDGMTLSSITSYMEGSRQLERALTLFAPLFDSAYIGPNFPASASIPFATGGGYNRFTQELQITSDGNDSLEWITGLYYADEENFGNVSISAVPSGFILVGAETDAQYKELAAFGNVTYYLTSDFDVTVGARLSRNEITNSPSSRSTSPLTAHDVSITAETKDTVGTYSLALRYRPDEDMSLYARVSSGYRPGTVDTNPSTGVVGEVDSDSLWSYEIGAKGDIAEGLISYDLALYYFDWDNFQAVLNDGPVAFLMTNTEGGITGKGVEASVTLRPLDGISVITNMAYSSSELNEDESGLNGLKGQQTPHVPKWSASSRLRYDFTLASGQEAFANVSVRYEDSARSSYTNGTPFSANNLPSDSYVAVDLSAGVTFNTVTLGLYAANLLNERAIQSIYSDPNENRGVPIKPRTLGLRLSIDF